MMSINNAQAKAIFADFIAAAKGEHA
jgi:hypothetical protein